MYFYVPNGCIVLKNPEKDKYRCSVDAERACSATVITPGCYISCMHFMLCQLLHVIFSVVIARWHHYW